MSPCEPCAPIVVGIDSNGSSDDALAWATAEAAAQRRPLRIVHVFRWTITVDPYVGTPVIDSLTVAQAAAEQILRDATAQARAVASDIAVCARLVPGPAERILLDQSRDARLLVLGGGGRRRLHRLLAGPVTVRIAARASCPVAVIRASRGLHATRSAPRVVVGVDGTEDSTPAVRFAFQAARQRSIPLTALHAWRPDIPADLEGACAPTAHAAAAAHTVLERALSPWRDEFADVPVVTKLVRTDPARALIAESREAALLVIGARGRGPVLGTLRGSVSETVLHRASGPITIVRHRPDQADRPRHRRGGPRRRPAPDRWQVDHPASRIPPREEHPDRQPRDRL